jgi:hypothetical protein
MCYKHFSGFKMVKEIKINVGDDSRVLDGGKRKLREDGKALNQVESGEEFYREKNEVRTVLRVKDWKNRHDPDSYHELITNTDTGAVIKDFKQAFEHHQGHGSAKHKIPEFPDDWRRVAAYYIWEKGGRRSGRHINDWNRAIKELTNLWKAGRLPKPK